MAGGSDDERGRSPVGSGGRRSKSLSKSKSPVRRRSASRSRSREPRRVSRSRSRERRRVSRSRSRDRRRSPSRDRHRRSRSRSRGRHDGRRHSPPPRRDRSPPPAQGKQLFVAGIPFMMAERDLGDKFDRYGRVVNARVVRAPNGESRGFGFVEMETDDDAAAAVRKLDGTDWNGRRLLVEVAKRPRG